MTDFEVRALATADVGEAADLHLNAFPNSLLSGFGVRILTSLYTQFATDRSAIGFVARDQTDALIGIVVGTSQPNAFYRRAFAQHWSQCALALVNTLLRSPEKVRHLPRAIVLRDGTNRAPGTVLSYIFVDPDVKGTGLGSMLMATWEREASRAGARHAHLTTDADDNSRVNAFYVKSGWTLTRQFANAQGRTTNCYSKNLSADPEATI